MVGVRGTTLGRRSTRTVVPYPLGQHYLVDTSRQWCPSDTRPYPLGAGALGAHASCEGNSIQFTPPRSPMKSNNAAVTAGADFPQSLWQQETTAKLPSALWPLLRGFSQVGGVELNGKIGCQNGRQSTENEGPRTQGTTPLRVSPRGLSARGVPAPHSLSPSRPYPPRWHGCRCHVGIRLILCLKGGDTPR